MLRSGSSSDEETKRGWSNSTVDLMSRQATSSSSSSDGRKLRFESEDVDGLVLESDDFVEEFEYTPLWCKYPVIKQVVLVFFRAGGEDGFQRMTAGSWSTLFVVCGISIFSGFDWEILPMAIAQIQTSLEIPEDQIGLVNSVIKVGTIGSFGIAVYADKFGRRKSLVYSAFLFCFFTFTTGFSSSSQMYMVCQFFGRLFIDAKGTLCNTLIVETLSKDVRGWGLGTYQAMSALGAGIAYIIFGIVGGYSFGWRILYWLGVLQLPFLLYMIRYLPESHKFVHKSSTSGKSSSVLGSLFKRYPKRLVAATSIAVCNGVGLAPADIFKIKYMQDAHGYTPQQISITVLAMGIIAFSSFSLAGRASDRYGRKRFLIVFQISATIGVILFYRISSWVFVVFFFVQLQAGFVLIVVSNTYFGECFPTSARSSAQSFLRIVNVVSGVVGIALESLMYARTQSHWNNVTYFACISFISPVILYLFLPETSGIELDTISPEEPGISIDEPDDEISREGQFIQLTEMESI